MNPATDKQAPATGVGRRLPGGASLRLLGLLGIALAGLVLFASPAAPLGLPPRAVVAQGLTDTTIQLAWTAETGADSYRVYRDGGLITDQPGTQFDDTSLQPGSPHTYTVSTVSSGLESPLSTPASATTQAADNTSAPTQPGTISVSSITSSGAHLSWASSTDDLRIVGYRILRGPGGTPADQLTQISTNDSATSYTAANLRSGTSYTFGVMALDASNNHSPIRTVTFTTAASSDTTAPAAPSSSGTKPTAFSSSRIDVVWSASSSTDVASYRVFRDSVQVADVPLPLRRTFSDTGLAPSQTYSYTIRTVDSAGNVSNATTAKTATTLAPGTVQIPRGPYLQQVTQTTARLAWYTNLPTPSVVQYGQGSLTDTASDPVARTQHMMLIGGLSPGTSYQYRVGDGTVSSATATFSTAPPPGQTFSFAAVGDYGGGSLQEQQVADRIAAGGTQLVQTLGDNVYPDAQDPDFTTFYSDLDARLYKQYSQVINTQSFWLGNGNKEYYGDGAFWQNFWMPNNERWYSYDWGDAHFLVLDSEQPYTPGSPQYQFAAADLAANQSKAWRIVTIHRPPYSSTSNVSSSEGVKANLVPLFQAQNVQLVMSGNSHNYERSFPLINDQPTAGGVTYLVSGGGGNGHNAFTIPQPSWSAFRDDVLYEHVKVTVSPQSLQIGAIDAATGTVFDSATISAPAQQTGTIEVEKNLNPSSDAGLFNLQVDAQTEMTDASNGDSTGAITVNAGTNHSVGELAGTNTDLSNYSSQISCTRNGNPAESGSGTTLSGITVAAGDAVVCTFTNTRRGKVVVNEDSQPNDSQDFDFTAGGGLNPTSFQLDDDADPTLANFRTFDGVAPGSGYSVAETVPANWQLVSSTCDDGSQVTNIDVAPGETVTCTFVNRESYERPQGASPLYVSLVPSFRQCGTGANPANGAHAPPLATNSCTAIGATSSVALVGPQSNSFAQLATVPGDGNPNNGDQADIQLNSVSDDITTPAGDDYNPNPSGPDLTMVSRLRLTDELNCPTTSCSGPYDRAATAAEVDLSVPVDCVSIPNPHVGATCSVNTSADALVPGTVQEGGGTVAQVFRVRINDAGANGIRGDSDDRLFTQQGIYIP